MSFNISIRFPVPPTMEMSRPFIVRRNPAGELTSSMYVMTSGFKTMDEVDEASAELREINPAVEVIISKL